MENTAGFPELPLAGVVEQLTRSGFENTFNLGSDDESDGILECGRCGAHLDPSVVPQHGTWRFEGPSDPSDEAIVVALSCPACGSRGALVTSYGPSAGQETASVLAALCGPTEVARSEWTGAESAVQDATRDRNATRDALAELEAVLAGPASGRERQWLNEVRRALVAFLATLRHKADQDVETAALLSQIIVEEPRFLPRVQRLRAEHDDLRDSAASLLRQLSSAGDADEVEVVEVRNRIAELGRRFRAHRARESDLVYEAINVRLGEGD